MSRQFMEMIIPNELTFSDMRNPRAYHTTDDLFILESEDNTPKWGWLKHVSISRTDRYPSWDEIIAVKDHFFGDVDCMMVIPKKEDYVNISKRCFHVWQCPETWGIR